MYKLPKKPLFYAYLGLILVILLGSVGFTVAHEKGYRVVGLSIQKTSTLIMEVAEPQAWVFIAENPVRQTTSSEEVLNIPDVKPGKKLVTVIKNEYFPWSKKIDIPSDTELLLHPFLLKQDVQAKDIDRNSSEFLKVFRNFSNFTPQDSYQTEEHLISATENGVSIECLNEECDIPLIETEKPAITVYQFLNNPNVVIYGTSNEMRVSELIADLRISYKIFEGQNIKFYTEGDNIYIQDNGKYFKIDL